MKVIPVGDHCIGGDQRELLLRAAASPGWGRDLLFRPAAAGVGSAPKRWSVAPDVRPGGAAGARGAGRALRRRVEEARLLLH